MYSCRLSMPLRKSRMWRPNNDEIEKRELKIWEDSHTIAYNNKHRSTTKHTQHPIVAVQGEKINKISSYFLHYNVAIFVYRFIRNS